MPLEALPPHLVRESTLEQLISMLQDKEGLRERVSPEGFGPRVTDAVEAQRLLHKVASVSQEVLDLPFTWVSEPKLVLTQRLSQLPQQTLNLYALFLPITLPFLYVAFSQQATGAALWLVRGAALFLLAAPLLMYRRSRINIEHQCGYVRNWKGEAAIVVDQLPAIQFQSYVAHEYAHHVFYEHFGRNENGYVKEGWSRLVQWQVVRRLSRRENNPAYLTHALTQITSELKFACEVISMARGQRLPRQVRRIPTLYHRNPLRRAFTGMPGFNPLRLLDQAVGTASCLLAAQRFGLGEVLHRPASGRFVESSS